MGETECACTRRKRPLPAGAGGDQILNWQPAPLSLFCLLQGVDGLFDLLDALVLFHHHRKQGHHERQGMTRVGDRIHMFLGKGQQFIDDPLIRPHQDAPEAEQVGLVFLEDLDRGVGVWFHAPSIAGPADENNPPPGDFAGD